MNVLHISTCDSGGAGTCARQICQSIREYGINSEMIVLKKNSDDIHVHQVFNYSFFIYRVINKLLKILGLNITEKLRLLKLGKFNNTFYTSPRSIFDISKNPLVKKADIIHLHWVNNFLDYTSFFSNVHKPIIWTLHDENLFCGIAHYEDAIIKDEPLEIKYINLKQSVIPTIKNLGIVFLSNYFSNTYSNTQILSNAKKFIINNAVDCDKFHMFDRNTCRHELGLDKDLIYLVFVASSIMERRKGLHTLIKAVNIIKNKHLKIIAIGNDKGCQDDTIIKTGVINDFNLFSKYLSAADYFVMPSFKEAFSQAPIEAMACGLPVVVFPVSGTEELITKENGVRCKGYSVEDLVEGLKLALQIRYNKNIIRENVKKRFSPQIIAQKYIDTYNIMLSNR